MNATQRHYEDVVTMYLLTQCDMSCKFCYASKGLGKMAVNDAKGVIDFFTSIGADRISLTGGEALMHPHVDEIVQHAAKNGLKVNLFTSGSLLTAERLAQLAPHLQWLTLSLDGHKELNELMGRSIGHFESATQALAIAKTIAPELRIRVVTVVTQVNIGKLHPLGTLLSDPKLSPTWWRLKQMVSLRRAKKHEKQLAVPDDKFLAEIADLKNNFSNQIDLEGSLAISKSADIMIIHPDGNCTTTKYQEHEFQLENLGNILKTPKGVVEKWWELRDQENAKFYQGIWARSNG